MIKVNSLIDLLKKNNTKFYAGVPDSVLKELSYSLQKVEKKNHIIATNEGLLYHWVLVTIFQLNAYHVYICKILASLMH